ncbi:MAG: hypothetical protein J6P49_01360, partial [Paludibacteraceae bacterium]|nr:hypothetical protein [Paludibacteraceae bacterium]
KETIDFYMDAVKNAGMNLVRVWGGGTYETEYFYDACDRNGVLVWQDFGFACSAYPFYDEEFLANVKAEAADNIKRLRHLNPSSTLSNEQIQKAPIEFKTTK